MLAYNITFVTSHQSFIPSSVYLPSAEVTSLFVNTLATRHTAGATAKRKGVMITCSTKDTSHMMIHNKLDVTD